MTNFEKIEQIASENNGLITRTQAAKEGVQSWYFTKLVKDRKLERVSRGIYLKKGSTNYDEDYFFQLNNTKCIYSYQSALYFHGLTDRVPFTKDVTVPRGYNAPLLSKVATIHTVSKDWYELGKCKIKTPVGNEVFAYDMERTICDIVRDRKNQDSEIFAKAIHFYLKKNNKNIQKLNEYAKVFGISKKISDIFEVAQYLDA